MTARTPLLSDIIELSVIDDKILQIKYIQFHPKVNILTYSYQLNKSLFKDVMEKLSLMGHNRDSLLKDLKLIGELIYKLFFFDSDGHRISIMDSLFSGNHNLSLFFNGEIEHIPFELAYNGRDFISLKRQITRHVPTNDLSEKDSSDGPIESLLVIGDPCANSTNSYNESINLFNSLKSTCQPAIKRLEYLSKELNCLEFQDILERYDLIHYAGHGEYHPESGGTLLIGKNTTFKASDLLSISNPPRLIFLNACLIAKTATGGRESLIHKLLKLGVTNIIASDWLILDEDFSSFLNVIYHSIFSGMTVGQSFLDAKRKSFTSGSHQWVYFSLYGSPTTVLY
ncbi:MAG: CHAT domain-containing protein [Spirochaetota bacterium]|nr:CHAT domain-containing protein [Spirochaetota bacterium]